MSGPRIGAHIGDQTDPVGEAKARDADLVQFFLGDPQGWKDPVVAHPGGAAGLRAQAEEAGIDLYVHAPYVLNVATTNNRIRIPSRKLLHKTVELATALGVRGVIVHGGHVLANDDAAAGRENWVKTIERADLTVPLLIENTAGGTNAMARTLDAWVALWETLAERTDLTNVGVCLDTCHAHAGGIDLAGAVDAVRAVTGRIDLVHANDSKDPFDSGRDRHANFGDGQIDPADLLAVVAAAGAPVVCETPGGVAGQGADIAWLRQHLPERAPERPPRHPVSADRRDRGTSAS
jgi:deoxyribonuclease-4